MSSNFVRARRAALAMAALAACSSYAQSVAALDSVVVTATRSPQDPKSLAAGLTVIDASAIRDIGASSVNEAIRWLAGVPGRTSTNGSGEQSLDLRGFGEAAGSNLVVLVDGVRQNEGDFSGSRLSWLPLESVQRIEVLRGSAAVLYGEGATGGVINVVTSQGLDDAGARANLGLGSDGLRQARASVSGVQEALRWQLSVAARDTDNHRDNFDHSERNGVGRLTWESDGTLLSARLGLTASKGGLPGGLTPAEAASTPWRSFKLQDRSEQDASNLLLSAEFNAGDWRVALDAGRRSSETASDFVSDSYSSVVGITSWRNSARAWQSYKVATMAMTTLAGLDLERWDSSRDNQSSWSGQTHAEIKQRSQALYIRQEMRSSDGRSNAFVGVRRTLTERVASGAQGGRIDPNNTSWELGGVYGLADLGEVYGRWGTSFRLPNADEFSCYVGYGPCSSSTVSLWQPQTSRDLELGWRRTSGNLAHAVRVYRSALRNELGLDASQFNNVNYDPTRRQGLETEMSWKPNPKTELAAVLNLRSARFTQGAHAGKAVPLVSQQTLTLKWQHKLNERQSLLWLTQLQSAQRIAGDLSNTCVDRIGGFGTTRVRYAHRLGDWEWALTVNNLFDRQYVNYRTRCNPNSRSVYPEAGRSWLMSVQRSF